MLQKNKFTPSSSTRWKPRNKLAAIVTSKASWIHQPVFHEPEIKTPQQRQQEWLKGVRSVIEQKEREEAERQERKKIAREAKKLVKPPKEKVRKIRCNWVTRMLRKRHKEMGWDPPTKRQIRAEKCKQPNYGKPMFTKEHMERQLASLTDDARDHYEDALAEMDCFGDPCQSQHEKALEKAVKWQAERKSAIHELEYGGE